MVARRAVTIVNGITSQIPNADSLLVGTGIDASAAGALTIGDTTATSITIGSALITTDFPGPVTLTGDVTTVGGTTFTTDATFEGDVTFGNANTDTVDFVAKVDSDIVFTGGAPTYGIQNMIDPTNPQDAATKNYVDSQIALIPAATPAGADTEIQYNNSGAFGADPKFTYSAATSSFALNPSSQPAGSSFDIRAQTGAMRASSGNLTIEALSGTFTIESNNGALNLASGATASLSGYNGVDISAFVAGNADVDINAQQNVNITAGNNTANGDVVHNTPVGASIFNGGPLALQEIAAPAATAGYGKIYVKSSDSNLYFKDDAGTEYQITPAPTPAAAGADTEIQFNSLGAFSASSSLTWNGSGGTNALAAPIFSLAEGSVPANTVGFGKLWADTTDKALHFYDNSVDYLVTPNTVQTITYAASVALDFDPALPPLKSVTLTGDIAFTTTNLGASRNISVRVIGDTVSRNLTSFPAGWTWLGGTVPTVLPANQTAILSLASFSNNDANVVASWSYTGSVNVTQVTASAPLASSGGTTPNISLTGTVGVANGGTGTSTAFTQGSVVFAGAAGVYSQNNSALYWDNTLGRLGVGTNTLTHTFNVGSGASTNFAVASGGKIHTYGGANPTDGQILIGNTAQARFDAASITAGTGISVTNGAGTITIAATGATTATGIEVSLITTGLTQENVGYVTSTGETAGNANASAASNPSAPYRAARGIGFVSVVGGAGTGKIQVSGIRPAVNFIAGLTLAVGEPAYVSLTSGKLTNDVSLFGTGDVICEVGTITKVLNAGGGDGAADVLIQPKSITVL